MYLELIGGRQPDFALNVVSSTAGPAIAADYVPPERPKKLAPRLSSEEAAAHDAFIDTLGEGAVWRQV